MYRKPQVNQLAFEDCVLPFGGKLRTDNRWVILAKQIPWADVDSAYAQRFPKRTWGRPRNPRDSLWVAGLKEYMKWPAGCLVA